MKIVSVIDCFTPFPKNAFLTMNEFAFSGQRLGDQDLDSEGEQEILIKFNNLNIVVWIKFNYFTL